MKMSASLELIWNLAAREAVAAKHECIEPEHFLMALLKFSELSPAEIEKVVTGAEMAGLLAKEVKTLRQNLEKRAIESTATRRQIRSGLGQGNHAYGGGVVHRSQSSRTFFDSAARLAAKHGDEILVAPHLLEAILTSPTALLATVMKDSHSLGPRPASLSGSLETAGTNLTQLVHEGKITVPANRDMEGAVLTQFLAHGKRPLVLLIAESYDLAREVVLAAACAMASPEALPALKDKRLVDISATGGFGDDVDEALASLEDLLILAAKENQVILFLPPLESAHDPLSTSAWADLVKNALKKKTIQCIGWATPVAYQGWIEKDADWKRVCAAIWVHLTVQADIPLEL